MHHNMYTTDQKFGVSTILVFKDTFIQQEGTTFIITEDSIDMYMN